MMSHVMRCLGKQLLIQHGFATQFIEEQAYALSAHRDMGRHGVDVAGHPKQEEEME